MSGKDAVLFFDTETTGLIRKDLPVGDTAQPHCVQIAALLCNKEGEIQSSLNLLVRADGWRIPAQATQVHGITEAQTRQYGVREEIAAEIFYNLASNAFAIVGHNIGFDISVIETLFYRVKKSAWRLPEHKYCTMNLSKRTLNLPPTQKMLNAESPLEENVLSEEEAKEKFGEALVDEVQDTFTEDARQTLSAEEEALSRAEAALEDEERSHSGEALQAPSSEEKDLSEEEAKEKFGEELVDEAQEAFAEDAQETFALTAEESEPKADHLLSDNGIQALLAVFWEGFQRPEEERKAFFKDALSQDEFRFFPLLADPMKLPLLPLGEEKAPVLENNFAKTGGFALLVIPKMGHAELFDILGTLVFAIGFTAIVFLFCARWLRRPVLFTLAKFLHKLPKVSEKLLPLVGHIFDALDIVARPSVMLKVMFFSALTWLGEWGTFIFIALGIPSLAKPMASLLAMPMATLSTAIPAAPGAIGTFDEAAKKAMNALGNSVDSSAAYALLIHAVIWAVPIVMAVIGFIGHDWRGPKEASSKVTRN
ncbi:exonuclease rnase t and dna polymerase iii [Lasius niger]|uniref:Exonuclease rnase t and dna polymerase iii n=1 Tax=Lasius niger TaxID=67767 RepID=A0A0J7NN34_LASNI|nr:exonuclease rnase t and dna polymerase iii [Lasius niger]